jgi:hypothetical protein
MCVILWTLALSGAVAILASVAFVYAGVHFHRRRDEGDGGAAASFAIWWLGLATYTALGGIESVLGSVGAASFPLFVALRYASLPVLCAALGGLAYYILYLRTGSPRWRWAVALYFGALAAAFVAIIAINRPTGLDIQRWRTDLTYASPIDGALLQVVLLLIVVPEALAAIAYIALYKRTEDRAVRYRILTIGVGLLVWLAAAFLTRATKDDLGQLLARPVLGVVIAAAILMAYRPPAWLRARFEGTSPVPTTRALALQSRIRDLV